LVRDLRGERGFPLLDVTQRPDSRNQRENCTRRVSHACSYRDEVDIESYARNQFVAAAHMLMMFDIANGELGLLVCDEPKTLACIGPK